MESEAFSRPSKSNMVAAGLSRLPAVVVMFDFGRSARLIVSELDLYGNDVNHAKKERTSETGVVQALNDSGGELLSLSGIMPPTGLEPVTWRKIAISDRTKIV